MSRVIVIGGSGHVGTFLIPSLVELGHDVVNVSRGQAKHYVANSAWDKVEQVKSDRKAEEEDGTFAKRIADLRPDIVVDMISFDLPSTQGLVEVLRGKVEHFIHASTLWVYGHGTALPADENQPMNAFGEYGINKAKTETWLMNEARRGGFPATIFRPGHIVGPGWAPINPIANAIPEVFSKITRGEELLLPNNGLETIHHVHAADVAQIVLKSITNHSASVGEVFNAVSDKALNLRGYAEEMYRWFGHEPKLGFMPLDAWMKTMPKAEAYHSWEHITRSSCLTVEKARKRLGYEPAYTSLSAVKESVLDLIANGKVEKPAKWG